MSSMVRKIYLEIYYSEKDVAKELAARSGSRIRWDPKLKQWYWKGSGNLPKILERYLPDVDVGKVEELNEEEVEKVEKLFHLKLERKPRQRILQAVQVPGGDGHCFEFHPRKKKDDDED
jgi:hypothetical protein